MGTKNKTTNTSSGTQTVAPPSWALPQMQEIASGIMNGLNTIKTIPAYTGDIVAQPNALTQSVPQAYLDAASVARSLVPQAQGALDASGQMPTFALGGNVLQAAANSYGSTNPGGMTAAVNAAIDPVYKQLTQSILPSLQSSGIESGAYGGSRALVTLPGQALSDFSHEAGNIAATLNYQDYADTANRALQAYSADTTRGLGAADVLTQRLGLTPDLLNAVMRMSGGAADLTNQAATIDQQNRQAVLDNNMQRYQYQMTQPFNGYDIATQLISQLAGNYGTTTAQGTTTQTQKTGGLGPVLGGIFGLGSMLMGLPTKGGGSVGGNLFG